MKIILYCNLVLIAVYFVKTFFNMVRKCQNEKLYREDRALFILAFCNLFVPAKQLPYRTLDLLETGRVNGYFLWNTIALSYTIS